MELSSPAVLPVSVLVPTRNSISTLPAHVAQMRPWLPMVEEVIVVDSHSNDGTVEFLRRELKHPRLRVLTHPPGLYQSWNHGIAACASEWIYISTVGDSIEARGLRTLMALAVEGNCDVVISPPEWVTSGGGIVKKRWPVSELIRTVPLEGRVVLAPELVLLFALTFMRKSILGSSASNLYRAATLRGRPFPTDFGHAGDVGWGLRHATGIRLGIVTEVVSRFLLHSRAKQSVENSAEIRTHAARQTVQQVRDRFPPSVVKLSDALCRAWETFFAGQTNVEEARRNSRLGALSPATFRARSARSAALRKLSEVQAQALAWIGNRLRNPDVD